MKKFCIFIFLSLLATSLYPQTDSSVSKLDFRFKSLQADFTTLILVNTFSGSADFDFYSDGGKGSAGIRAGFDYYGIGDVGGGFREGSPCTDLNILARATLSDRILRIDVYGGLTSHNTSKGGDYNGIYSKFGIEFKARIYGDYVGLIGKLGITKAAYGGFGIFVGYGK